MVKFIFIILAIWLACVILHEIFDRKRKARMKRAIKKYDEKVNRDI